MAKLKEKQLSLAIHDIKFDIEENEENGQRRGVASFHVLRSFDSRVVEEYDLTVDIISCWQLISTPTCVKAHLILKTNTYHHLLFQKDMKKLGEVKINSRDTCMDHVDFSMILNARVLRYGQSSSKKGYIQTTDPLTKSRMKIYESKAKAIADIIDCIRIDRSIGGFKRINFSKLSDDILEGVGFTKMPDILGRGVAMWTGHASSAVSTGEAWDRGAEERERANQESFLNIIQSSIQ